MNWTILQFLAEPWFVLPWYAVGAAGAAFVAYDITGVNTPLKPAMKWAWPIIVFFFSVFGLVLYFVSARAPGIHKLESAEAKQRAHDEYEKNMFRRVNGAVIHCVAGDGIGIVTAMVIARAVRMSPWQEFWFEYAAGFAIGLFVFQLKSMMMMTDSKPRALAMAFRAEFFSMLSVMAGMGAVMLYVTPLAVTTQPRPLTYAFWGFAMLGLVVGYVFTYPMNLMLVKIGWEHGMGSKEGARPVEEPGGKLALAGAMCIYGFAALLVPGLLSEVRHGNAAGELADQAPSAYGAMRAGLRETLTSAHDNIHSSQARVSLDGARRLAKIAAASVPGSLYTPVLANIENARHELWMGREQRASDALHAAIVLVDATPSELTPATDARGREGATVIDVHGRPIGELGAISATDARVEVGGIHDFWGFLDIDEGQNRRVPLSSLVFGPHQNVGPSFVLLTEPRADRHSLR